MTPNRSVLPVFLAVALAGLVGCSPPPPEPGEEASDDLSAYEERGRALADELKTQLKGELVAALAEGGPQAAIGVCSVRAPEIAAELSVEGVEVGRATHKPRNPDNAASGWLDPIVAAYVASNGEGGPTVVALPDGRVGYAEPIRVQPPCLACHGSEIAEPVLEEIRTAYPEDRAVGFAEGDFRGVVWITMPREDVSGAAGRP